MSKLKILREVNNYTQEFIAETLGVDQSTYSKLEKNPKNLKADQAEKLASLYEVDVADILSAGVTLSFTQSNSNKGYGYVHNYFEQKEVIDKIVAVKDEQIATLKGQVESLQKQVDQFMKIIASK